MSNGDSPQDGTDFGWRVHAMLEAWTGKADTKASITLAICTAVVGLVVNFSKEAGPLTNLQDGHLAWYRLGVTLLVAAIALTLSVVTPQLRRRANREEAKSNFIYFGHLRYWDPVKLERQLKNLKTTERQLSQQMVQMSKVAWRKHSLLQFALLALSLAAMCFLLAGAG